MAKVQLTVWGYRCERCEHEWIPRTDAEPAVCPSCKSPYWNRPRTRAVAKKATVKKKASGSRRSE